MLLFILYISLLVPETWTQPLLYPFKIDTTVGQYEIRINWTPDYDRKVVEFAVELSSADKLKWIGFGFSDHGNYKHADLCVFTEDEVTDSYTDRQGVIRTDVQQDCRNGTNTIHPDGRLTLTFVRSFDTCDDREDLPIEDGTTQLLILLGGARRRNVYARGVQRKVVPNRLLRSVTEPPVQLGDDVQQWDVTVDDVPVPARETTYWCTVVQLDEQTIKNKHHLVKYEKLIRKGSESVVHHMEVYHCNRPTGGGKMPLYNGDCTEGQQPPETKFCRKVLAAWARGAEPMVYPIEAGVPIGGDNFYPYLMVEIHYNNPEKKSGIVDNSGMRFSMTPNLRPHDAGIMELGLIYSDTMAIPPGMELFQLQGYCVPQCTELGLPNEGINIFASQLHAHLTGRALFTVHMRDGVKLGYVNKDNNFNQNWQEIRPVQPHVNVLPGDSLITACIYNTESRKDVTLGGLSIRNEMCVNYIHYYPKTKLEVCKSAIDNRTLATFFRNAARYGNQRTSADKSTADNYKAIDWGYKSVTRLSQLYRKAKLEIDCLQDTGARYEGAWSHVEQPEILGWHQEDTSADDLCAVN